MDLTLPNWAYFYGFALCDGTLTESTRNRGRLQIELSLESESLLRKFQTLVLYPSSLQSRTRDTNFKVNYKSVIFRVCALDFRNELKAQGFPAGRKDRRQTPPLGRYSEPDFWRGVIDANGSIGVSATGLPFLSVGTNSDALADGIKAFLLTTSGLVCTTARNKRDDFYNIIAAGKHVGPLVSTLSYPGCLALKAKADSAEAALAQFNQMRVARGWAVGAGE